MKQVLMTVAIVAIVFTTPIDAAEVVESQINDSAIAYEQAGGQARFMGGASPIANESNLYGNSEMQDGGKCMSTTFKNPESVYFSSITAYDAQRYLFEDEDVLHVNSNTWEVNSDNTVTVSFNCGDGAKNNIDSKGQDYTFTTRFYGVTDQVIRANQKNSIPNRLNLMHMIIEGTRN